MSDDAEEELDSLTNDFERLRESIAAELRRAAGGNGGNGGGRPPSANVVHVPPRQPPPPPVQREPVMQPAASAPLSGHREADDEIPAFHTLRENLLGNVPSSGARMPKQQVALQAHNTVKIATAPSRAVDPAAAGYAALDQEFQTLRASLSAKLRGTSSQGLRASGVTPSVPLSAVPPPPPPPPPVDGADAHVSHPNTVFLSARKPGAHGGPAVVAAMDAGAAAIHGAARGPPPRQKVDVTTPGAAATIAAAAAVPNDAGSAATVRLAGRDATIASDRPFGFVAASNGDEMMFGHVAMRAALESHRAHYEAARAQLPAVAQYRPRSGVMPVPPPPVPKSRRSTVGKPPTLATAARSRPQPDGLSAALPTDTLERLRRAAASKSDGANEDDGPARPTIDVQRPGTQPGAKTASTARPARKVALARSEAKADAAGQPTSARRAAPSGPGTAATPVGRTGSGSLKPSARQVRIPITRPTTSAGVAGGEFTGGGAPNNAPLLQVTGAGVPPSLQSIRATERLVAAVAAAEPPPQPDGPSRLLEREVAQFTEGLGNTPMSAVQAWAANSAGEARQSELLGEMAAHSAKLYRSTIEQLS